MLNFLTNTFESLIHCWCHKRCWCWCRTEGGEETTPEVVQNGKSSLSRRGQSGHDEMLIK